MKTIKRNYIIYLIGILFLFSSLNLVAEDGIKYCTEYIKAWGLVKYYSPFARDIIPKVDSAFQSDIRNILKNNNRRTLNEAIEKLINYSRHKYKPIIRIESDFNILMKLDSINKWVFDNKNISNSNKTRLIDLIHLQRDTINPFVRNNPTNLASEFINEKQFLATFPNAELRLLALARFWNAVNFFYPYKNLIPIDWDKVLPENINELVICDNELDYHLILLKLGTSIKDGHGKVNSYQIERNYGYFQLPFFVTNINSQLFITDINETEINKTIKFGDILLEINHKTFEQYFRDDSIYIWGSNINRIKNISANNFLKTKQEQLNNIKVLRNDSIYNFQITSKHTTILSKTKFLDYRNNDGLLISDEYIYIDLSKIDSIEFEKSILKYDRPCIIIDLRLYPNWILNQISDLFAKDKIPFAAYFCTDISKPGIFSNPKDLMLNPRRSNHKANYTKIILLVDYTTISRGEFLSMAFQALPNVFTFGDNTAGADGNISQITLPGNVVMKFSGLGIEYPNSLKCQQDGIKIDKYYKNQGEGIAFGKDEQLDVIIRSIIIEGKK